MLAWCAGKSCGPTFAVTRQRLMRRHDGAIAGASIGQWRALYMRHPEAMRKSYRKLVRSLVAHFDAEDASAAARAAVERMLEQHKPPR